MAIPRGVSGTCRALGFPLTRDHNHPDATGVGSGEWNIDANRTRISTAIAYLMPARGRPNLAIRPDCLVDRVVFDGRRAVGVEVVQNGVREIIPGRRITLSGGAIGSPSILLRSGVGPVGELKAMGIEPILSLSGVGRNLTDHANLRLNWNAVPGPVDESAQCFQVLLRYTAPGSNVANDMQIVPSQVPAQPLLKLAAALMKPLSRGTLRLHSADANEQPDIRLNLASDPEDARRLREAVRLLAAFVQTPNSRLSARKTLSSTTATLFGRQNSPASPSETSGRMLLSNALWPTMLMPSWISMRVHGLAGLRVADASIMPTIPRANTHLTCVVIGERVAEWMRVQAD